jgi:Fe-S cluster assembly iron-binding protein IscA
MTLDESQPNDKLVEAKGLRFLFDPFAASQIDEVQIDYDEFEEDFSVRVPNAPQSTC